MTSTNDGKDVKSNQNSGPRGKTYYIELYKSLEARLNEECSLRARNKHVCEAWRRIHSLCQHSAPTTHAHLLGWLQRHTARTVLHTEWPKSKDEHTFLQDAIQTFIQECDTAIVSRNGNSPPWESQLLQRSEWFKTILSNPWGHPVLKVLLDPQGKPPTDNEVLEWLKEERGVMFVTRLRQLAASKCDDLALMLASSVMDRVRAGIVDLTDVEQLEDVRDTSISEDAEPTLADLLKRDAGFTIDVWELLTDLEFVLLHKWNKQSQCITLAKRTPLRKGYQLVERLRCRPETSPREKKLWKNSKDAATLIAQVIIARCMVVPRCTGPARSALQGCARSLARLLPAARLPPAAAALAAPAASAAHLHALAAAVHAQVPTEMKPFICELYVRAITAGMNELEKLKLKTEKESEARSTERTLSSWFTQLGGLLSASARIRCECTLTAFSVHPSPLMYAEIEAAPALPPLAIDFDIKEESKAEFGSWANDSRSQTNFVKTSETLNLKQTQQRANVLSTAIFAEGEALGLSAELCQDLAVCLSGPRVKTLSWATDREQLLENCRSYMERTSGGTRALTTELKYLNLDPSAYEHLPEEDDDENDIYYGIEKGYEHLVEFQEPEEIWQFDPEETESASSNIETECINIKRRKKKKRLIFMSEEDTDPLSLTSENKETEKKKERPHSKERSNKHRKKKSEKHPKNEEHNCERLKDNSQVKEKKKEKKTKKEKVSKEQKSSSLTSLIGIKVSKLPAPVKTESETKLIITDSDYDSQGKSSMTSVNSEGNDSIVLFDGLFSMDDYKSPERNNPLIDKFTLNNSELSNVQEDESLNEHTKAATKITLEKCQSLDIATSSTQLLAPTSLTIVKPQPNIKTEASQIQLQEAAKVNAAREEVKKSIKKLLDFRRQNYSNDNIFISCNQSINCDKIDNVPQSAKAITTQDFPSQSFVSPKAVAVPTIPKVYINKKQTEELNELKQKVNSFIHMNNAANTLQWDEKVTVTKPLQNTRKAMRTSISDLDYVDTAMSANNYSDSLKSTFQNKVVSTASNSDRANVLNKNKQHRPTCNSNNVLGQQHTACSESQEQKNFQDFLKELQQTINAGTSQNLAEMPPVSNSSGTARKQLKPMSKVTPLIPNTNRQLQCAVNSQCAKQIVHPKKMEHAPNTFSRLSYMHKHKQSDAKLKQNDMNNRQDHLLKESSIDLARRIAESNNTNLRYQQTNKDSTRTVRGQSVKHNSNVYYNRNLEPRSSLVQDCPIMSNILLSKPNKKNNFLSTPTNKQVTRDDNSSKLTTRNLEQPRISVNSPTMKSYLSEKDQNDLILLLRQQNRINAGSSMSKIETSVHKDEYKSSINGINHISTKTYGSYNSIVTDQSNNVQQYVGQKVKTTVLPKVVEVSKNNSSSKILETKSIKTKGERVSTCSNNKRNVIKKTPITKVKHNSVKSEQKSRNMTSSPQDWESVMNAIRAQKTPSRDPSALEVKLKRDNENNLRNQRIVRTTSTPKDRKSPNTCHINQMSNKTNTPEICSSPVIQGMHIAQTTHLEVQKKQQVFKNTVNPPKKLPCEQKKLLSHETAYEKDPFISGLENSDYDLLEELMDDELRQEIRELSSDDESYTRMLLPKGNKLTGTENNDIKSRSISSHQKDKTVAMDLKSNQNISNRLLNCSEPMQRTTLKTNYHTKPLIDSSLSSSRAMTNRNLHIHTDKVENSKGYCNIPTILNNINHQSDESMPTNGSKKCDFLVKDNIVKNQTSDSGNIFITPVPQQAQSAVQNVLLIGSDMFYDPYAVSTSLQSTAPYVLPNNAPNITLYHTTQFTTPDINPVAVTNTIATLPLSTQSGAISSYNMPSISSSQPYVTPSMNLTDRSMITNQGTTRDNNIVLKTNHRPASDCLLANTRSKLENKNNLDINSNRSCERKVLSEVQDKQKLMTVEKSGNKILKNQRQSSDDDKTALKSEGVDDNSRILKNERIEVTDYLLNETVSDHAKAEARMTVKHKSNDTLCLNEILRLPEISDDTCKSNKQNSIDNDLLKISMTKLNETSDTKESSVCQNISSCNKIVQKHLMDHETTKNNINLYNVATRKDNVRDINDAERLKKKRLAITTREINNSCYYPPIPLSYIPLNIEDGIKKMFQVNTTHTVTKENSSDSNIREEYCTNLPNTQPQDQGLKNEKCNENKSIQSDCPHIKLRSSNKNVENPTNLNIPSVRNRKVRLKSDVTAENEQNFCEKIEMQNNLSKKKPTIIRKRTSKRIVDKETTVKSDITAHTSVNRPPAKSMYPIIGGEQNISVDIRNSHDIEDKLLRSKIPNTKLKDILHEPTFLSQQPVDIESSNLIKKMQNDNLVHHEGECRVASKLSEDQENYEAITSVNSDIDFQTLLADRQNQKRNATVCHQGTDRVMSSDKNNKTNEFVNPKEVGLPEIISVRRLRKGSTDRVSKSSVVKSIEPKIKSAMGCRNKSFKSDMKLRNKTIAKNMATANEDIAVARTVHRNNYSGTPGLKTFNTSLPYSEKIELPIKDKTIRSDDITFIDCMLPKSDEATPRNISPSLLCSEKMELCSDGEYNRTEISSRKTIDSYETTKNCRLFKNNTENKTVPKNISSCLSSVEANVTNTEFMGNTLRKPRENVVDYTQTSQPKLPISQTNNQCSLIEKEKISTELLCADDHTTKLTNQKPVPQLNSNNQIQASQDTIDFSSVPESLKRNVIIEELQDQNMNDSNKKCVRVKLPNGRTFKATIYGKLYTDFESLFSDPVMKSMLLNNIADNKRYTLNVKQVTTPKGDNSKSSAISHIEEIAMHSKRLLKEVETINLLSDDEDDATCFEFQTEFGRYKTSLKDKKMFEIHQTKFGQKCCVTLIRYQPTKTPTKIISNTSDQNLDGNLSPTYNFNSNTERHEIVTTDISDNAVTVIQQDNRESLQEKCNVSNENSDIIEVDDSSNDSIDILKNCPILSMDVVTVAQDVVQQLENVSVHDNFEADTDKNIAIINNVQENCTEKDSTLQSIVQIDRQQDVYLSSAKTRECVVSLSKCDDLVSKYLDVNSRKCFIKLVRYDSLVKNVKVPLNHNITDDTMDVLMDAEDFIPVSVLSVPKMIRSESLSIQNDSSKYDHTIYTNETAIQTPRSTSPVIDVFETIVALEDYQDVVEKGNKNDQPTENITCDCEWFISKRQLSMITFLTNRNSHEQCLQTAIKININQHNYKNDFLRDKKLCDQSMVREQSDILLKHTGNRSQYKYDINKPSIIYKVPSLKHLTTSYFQINPVVKLIWPTCDDTSAIKVVTTHKLKRKSHYSDSTAVANKVLKISENKAHCWKGIHYLDNKTFRDKHYENNYHYPATTGNCSYNLLIGHCKKSEKHIEDHIITAIERENSKETPATTVSKDEIIENLNKIQDKIVVLPKIHNTKNSDFFKTDLVIEKEDTLLNDHAEKLLIKSETKVHDHNKNHSDLQYLANTDKHIQNDVNCDPNMYNPTTRITNQSMFHKMQQNVKNIEIGSHEHKINDDPLCSSEHKCSEFTELINIQNSLNNDNKIHKSKKDIPINEESKTLNDVNESNSEINNEKPTLLDAKHILNSPEVQLEKLYSLLLDHEYIGEFNITKREKESSIHEIEESTVSENISKNIQPQKDNRSKINNSENSYQNSSDKILLLREEDPSVVLEGVEFEDPVVGTCYVFPIDENSTASSGNNVSNYTREEIIEMIQENVSGSDENITSYSESQLEVIVPKNTYSNAIYSDESNLENVKLKRNLKRKIDVGDGKHSEKKYRKGKNIDYPKITAAAIIESGYSKEYKRLFDYFSSLKFSYSRSFLKEHIDVSDMIKDWPIAGTCAENSAISTSPEDCYLFSDSNHVPTSVYSPFNQTLSEEIDAEYIEINTPINENETNFKMGFGEGSDRVMQNLEDIIVSDYLKVSAATLSDVKHPQPFVFSEKYDDDQVQEFFKKTTIENDQLEKINRYMSHIKLHDKVQSYFKKTTIELKYDWIKENNKDIFDAPSFPFDFYVHDFMKPSPIDPIVQVVQVGQLPVSAGAQNPVTCDPRVTQVSNASPSQCSVENSPRDDSQTVIKTEYTELTTANLTLPIVQDYGQHNQSVPIESHEVSNLQTTDENIPIETEIKPVVKIELEEELPEDKDEANECQENSQSLNQTNNHVNDIDYAYDGDNGNACLDDPNIYNIGEKESVSETFSQKSENSGSEKTDQIAHAMNAAGITTTSETIADSTAHALVNILSQKIGQSTVAPANTQTTTNSYPKATSINAMALQQALAQILPPPLNQTNMSENNTQASNTQVTPQVLHIVQGKNASGSQITLVDNSQQSVISTPSATPVLHIVQNKAGTAGATANGTSGSQSNTFSGLSLVDTGLQQGGNQLLHIVNTGNQKNSNAGQLLKRVNLLTNLANVQGSNEQKMVQFVCKSADGKAIQLNAPHQRSMVLRLQPIESPNIQTNSSKPVEPQDMNTPQSIASTIPNKDNINSQQEIKSRSVYEENYAKFIQNSSSKPTVGEKSTTLPKFNQAFGKPVFQDGNQKSNEINVNNLASINTGTENSDCPPVVDNSVNLEHIGQIGSPPLLLRKSPAQTSQAQPNLVQQLKQTIGPMNIQTMHGGVIYTRQIPVNIGGGQTINLITVPSTELMDDSGQKQQTDVKFVNQGEMEPSIIKIVPQTQTTSNSEISAEDNAHMGVTNESMQNSQPVLTQMRIKLPMLSKTPQMVSGTRVVRPSFFQIQRNVIGGANQPVYQQLVLTAAPPLGQQTIRLPHSQVSRQIKVPSENQSTESQMSSSTLEQLREFDMVLEQVKERSTVQPNATSNSSFAKLHTSSTEVTDNGVSVSSTLTEPTQVLYSIGNNQPLNVAYVNRKATVTTPITSAYVRSPDSTGIVDSSTPSSHVQIPHTVTARTSPNEITHHPKPAKIGSKSKSRPKSSHLPSSMKLNTVPTKTSTQKPLEDEQTTQRILYILAEYKEQVENSPDKDKPAPRRRSNPPSNPSGSSKRKKSSSSSRRPGVRDLSPVHGDDTCRTMGSEDSSCGTSQGDCNESCLESHSPQDSPRKVVRKLTFEPETPPAQPRPQPQRNVIVADGQTITVARGTAGKPTTAVLMPANYILPVSMVKGGQQIAIVTNRGPKLLTVGGTEGGTTNALLLQRLIGPAGLKPVLARPGVRHVRLPTAALHNLQAFNLAAATAVHPPNSTASPAPAATPPELVETRANSSPWTDRESQEVKPERGSSPEGSEPWNLHTAADPHDYTYEETARADNLDRTVLIVHKKDGSAQRQHRLTHVSAAALRHKYAILEHELRLQKSLSEECEDLGVDSPSASDLFPEAELLFAASPAHDHTQDQGHHSHTPQPTLMNQSGIPQPDIDDQIATDQLLPRDSMDPQDLNLGLEDVGIVTVSEDGMQATIALDQEEFARSHPNTTFHSEPTEETEVHPFTIAGLKGRHITSTIFHSNRAPATVLMSTPQTTVISQATAEPNGVQNIKYTDIDSMIHALPSSHTNNINLSSVLVKDDGLTRFDSILNDTRELHLTNTASAIVHSTGNATQVIRRVCYDDDKRDRDTRFLLDDPDALIAGDDAKMIAEDSSRDATLESMADDDASSPERHTELFWESNSASERSEGRRPLDFSSDSDKCCKSPSCDETNSTDSSGAGPARCSLGAPAGAPGAAPGAAGARLRLHSVIREARSDGSSDDAPPLRTYPPKRSLSGKTRAGERSPDRRRRASGRGVVKRGCHCCNGEPAPPRPKKPRQRKPAMDFVD
ncbi:uncharacterized protein LOC131851674 [Achroia grisella]|uniref:uncharacterized protein LOC131851674 n=1 Tax=Achroia grisella TaxID=688607 RepID=UPI0027D31D10|nr:uncharacterized protein LOC131851674 [Achroia grisella]